MDQVRLLQSKGREVVLIARHDFPETDLPIRRYRDKPCSLKTALKGIETLLVHDVFFVDQFKREAQLLEDVLKDKDLRMIVWSHSVPGGTRSLRIKYPKTQYVSLSRINIPKIAQFYHTPENNVFYVPNHIDPSEYYGWEPLTRQIVWSTDALNRYPIFTYFTRTHPSKNPLPILKTIKSMVKMGFKPLFIWGNSYKSATEAPEILDQLKTFAVQNDLGQCLKITSEDPNLQIRDKGLDKRVVRELLDLGDIAMFPSISEAGSLSVLEAALSNNLLVLNKDVPSFVEFGGPEIVTNQSNTVLYESFGGLGKTITGFHPSEDEWYDDLAKRVLESLTENQALQAKRQVLERLNPNRVYYEYLEPLL